MALGFPSSSSWGAPDRDGDDGNRERKSISTERTIGAEGLDGQAASLAMARELCAHLMRDLEQAGVHGGKTVTLVLKGVDFQRHSRAQTVPAPVTTEGELWRVVKRLVEEFQPTVGRFRLMGVRLSALV